MPEHGGVAPRLERERCAKDSDWCDGRICRDRGVDCPNADPVDDDPESVAAAKDADEWPYDDDPPDPL